MKVKFTIFVIILIALISCSTKDELYQVIPFPLEASQLSVITQALAQAGQYYLVSSDNTIFTLGKDNAKFAKMFLIEKDLYPKPQANYK